MNNSYALFLIKINIQFDTNFTKLIHAIKLWHSLDFKEKDHARTSQRFAAWSLGIAKQVLRRGTSWWRIKIVELRDSIIRIVFLFYGYFVHVEISLDEEM